MFNLTMEDVKNYCEVRDKIFDFGLAVFQYIKDNYPEFLDYKYSFLEDIKIKNEKMTIIYSSPNRSKFSEIRHLKLSELTKDSWKDYIKEYIIITERNNKEIDKALREMFS